MTENDRANRAAKWSKGIPLGTSWTKYGDERQKALQLKNRGLGASKSYELLMIGAVVSRLSAGTLVAMGDRVAPYFSDGPDIIPADVFRGRVNTEVLDDVFTLNAEKFVRITVLEIEEYWSPGRSPVADDIMREAELASAYPAVKPDSSIQIISLDKRKRGRPLMHDKLVELIVAMIKGGMIDGLREEPRTTLIRAEIQRLHPYDFSGPQPDRSTIQKALAEARRSLKSEKSE